jgi:hypothetical protein
MTHSTGIVQYETKNIRIESVVLEGEEFKNRLKSKILSEKEINISTLLNLELFVYEDYSGINTYNGIDTNRIKSGFRTNQESTIGISNTDLIETAREYIDFIRRRKDVLDIIPKPNLEDKISQISLSNPVIYGTNEMLFIEYFKIEIFTIELKSHQMTPYLAYQSIIEAYNFFENSAAELKEKISYDEIFSKPTIMNYLLAVIQENEDFELLEKLILNKYDNNWFAYYITHEAIKTFANPLSKDEYLLLSKIINHDSILNEYWKSKLKDKYNINLSK